MAERLMGALLKLLVAAPGAFAAACLAISVAFDPVEIARRDHLVWLGLELAECPGCALCGLSRAFSAWSHGDLSAAVGFHAGVAVIWPLFVVLFVVSAVGVYRLWMSPPRFFIAPERLLA